MSTQREPIMSSILGSGGFAPRGLQGGAELAGPPVRCAIVTERETVASAAVETRPMVEVLNAEGRVHVVLPLGHRDVMDEKAYGAAQWSMRKVEQRVRR